MVWCDTCASNGPNRLGRQDTSIFSSSAQPMIQPNSKYAVMDSKYQSVNVPGLYFAGTLSHGKDFRRSAGGFIHGFRYTARALHRILSVEHEGEVRGPPPHTQNMDYPPPKRWA